VQMRQTTKAEVVKAREQMPAPEVGNSSYRPSTASVAVQICRLTGSKVEKLASAARDNAGTLRSTRARLFTPLLISTLSRVAPA
jgi:hypothetical protein